MSLTHINTNQLITAATINGWLDAINLLLAGVDAVGHQVLVPRTTNVSWDIIATDDVISVITDSGDVNIRLPAAALYTGRAFVVQWFGGAGVLAVLPSGSDLINGDASVTYEVAFQSLTYYSNFFGWLII